MEDLNVLGVITARGGSKGIPRKNIKELGGKPLIHYTIDAVNKSNLVTHSIVSTDGKEIADVAKSYGANIPFMRPKELAKDDTSHIPVMKHAIEEMEGILGLTFDIVVIFQPTSPFRTAEDIDMTIQKLIDTGADSSVSLVELIGTDHPMKAKKMEGDKVEAYSMEEEEGVRRQDLPTAYRRSGAVYAIKRDIILGGSLFGNKIVGHIVPNERSIDIDEPIDWVKAEYMLKELRESGSNF